MYKTIIYSILYNRSCYKAIVSCNKTECLLRGSAVKVPVAKPVFDPWNLHGWKREHWLPQVFLWPLPPHPFPKYIQYYYFFISIKSDRYGGRHPKTQHSNGWGKNITLKSRLGSTASKTLSQKENVSVNVNTIHNNIKKGFPNSSAGAIYSNSDHLIVHTCVKKVSHSKWAK